MSSPRHNGARHYASPGINVDDVHVELFSFVHESLGVAVLCTHAVGLHESTGVVGLYTPVSESPRVAGLYTLVVVSESPCVAGLYTLVVALSLRVGLSGLALSLRVGLSGRVTRCRR